MIYVLVFLHFISTDRLQYYQIGTYSDKQECLEQAEKAKILLSEKTSVADWERVMAENSGSSWKDEFFVIVLSIPLILAFVPGAEGIVDRGFEQLHKAPDWYFYSLGIAISASFGVKGYKQFVRKK